MIRTPEQIAADVPMTADELEAAIEAGWLDETPLEDDEPGESWDSQNREACKGMDANRHGWAGGWKL